MFPQFRSAWMPPEVAQAPMVTRKRHWRRISPIRSTSWAVVIEPSTKPTS